MEEMLDCSHVNNFIVTYNYPETVILSREDYTEMAALTYLVRGYDSQGLFLAYGPTKFRPAISIKPDEILDLSNKKFPKLGWAQCQHMDQR